MNIVILIRLENCSLPKSWKVAAYDAKTKRINFHVNSGKNEASAAQQNEMQWNFLFQYFRQIYLYKQSSSSHFSTQLFLEIIVM